ncbi:SAV_6107 family HEPN domain-containing protein [Devriesea agamarum]|uniref:SAV_6107 family HEPN domain-containing protein n=1 Tax=Devriesea agamarum TaxID=472569 RepID=UPI0012EDF021|nr:SAV_6107 family HEPN domain-containing protein [Devriesea agamarum]
MGKATLMNRARPSVGRGWHSAQAVAGRSLRDQRRKDDADLDELERIRKVLLAVEPEIASGHDAVMVGDAGAAVPGVAVGCPERAGERDAQRARFEAVHRVALRSAGVIVNRRNRQRKRRLPLNAWVALAACGDDWAAWSERFAGMVAERERLRGREDLAPAPGIVEEHLSLTSSFLMAVTEHVVKDQAGLAAIASAA